MPNHVESNGNLSWNHLIDSFARTTMEYTSRYVEKWADDIINRNGRIIENIDEKIQDAEDALLTDEATREQLKKERESLNKLVVDANSQMKKFNNEASRYKVESNKYRLEKDNLDKLKKDSKEYKEQERRLQKFKPSYEKWLESTQKAEEWLKKSQEYKSQLTKFIRNHSEYLVDDKKYNAGAKVTHLRAVLKNLLTDKALLENSVVKNMDKHKDVLVNAFKSQNYVDSISGMVFKTINGVLNGAFRSDDEFVEDEKFQILENIIINFDVKKMWDFNFLKVLAKEKRNFTDIKVGDDVLKVFDMDKISTDDMIKVFSAWFSEKVQRATLNALKDFKSKRSRFVREQRKTDDDESVSLYDRENAIDQSPYGSKIRTRNINKDEDVQNEFSELENYLKRNIGAITKTVNSSLQKQLPEKAYFRQIGSMQAEKELKKILAKVIDNVGSDFRNGFNSAFHRCRDIVKTALGGSENPEVFDMIYTIIRAALEYYIVSKMGNTLLDEIKGLSRDEAESKKELLYSLLEKREVSKRALQNSSLVRYAKRTCRIARRIVRDENFFDPEQMVENLLNANQFLEDKATFLLDEKPAPDASEARSDQFVDSRRPLRMMNDYGA